MNEETHLSADEWKRFEAVRKSLNIDDNWTALFLAILGRFDNCVSHDCLRRVLLAVFEEET